MLVKLGPFKLWAGVDVHEAFVLLNESRAIDIRGTSGPLEMPRSKLCRGPSKTAFLRQLFRSRLPTCFAIKPRKVNAGHSG